MSIKMIVTDLDRTLLRNNKTVSAYTLSVLEKARKSGIEFMIATARPEIAVKSFIPDLRYDYAIYHNGALVDICGQRTIHYGIPALQVMNICQAISEDYPNQRIVIEMDNMRYSNFNATEIWPEAEYKLTDFTNLPDKMAEKILIPTDNSDYHCFQKYLSDELYIQLSESTLHMIMNVKARKLTGIKTVCEYTNISLSDLVAFGDDLNDGEMLKACGIGVAVSNALDEVKALADEICLSNEEDGVAKWIEAYLL